MENLILANAVADRKAYNAVCLTGQQKTLSDQGKAVWSLIDEWYNRDQDSPSINLVLLANRAAQAYPRHADTFRELISDLGGKASPGNFSEILLENSRKNVAQELSMRLMEARYDEARELWQEFTALDVVVDEEEGLFQGTDPASLYHEVIEGECIPLAPPQLNESLKGGLLRGQNAMIFGPVEVGKSLLAINCLVAAARAGFKVGYWENEDAIIATQLRAAQACAGATEADLRSPSPRIRKALERGGWYERIIFRESPGGSLAEVRAWIEKHNLDFAVLNQLANFTTQSKDNRVLELGQLATGTRAIGKQTNCAMLSVHQAADSGRGKRVLGMGDLDWSNVAIQATMDVLIGMGMDEEQELQGRRTLSLCKNKRGYVHDRFLIRVLGDTQRIE